MPLALSGEQLLFLVLCLGPMPQIIDLTWIGPKVEELSEFLAEKMHQLPLARADHAHELGFLQNAIATVFGKDHFTPRPGRALQGGQDQFRFLTIQYCAFNRHPAKQKTAGACAKLRRL